MILAALSLLLIMYSFLRSTSAIFVVEVKLIIIDLQAYVPAIFVNGGRLCLSWIYEIFDVDSYRMVRRNNNTMQKQTSQEIVNVLQNRSNVHSDDSV